MNTEEIKSILLSIWPIGIEGEPAEAAGRLIATYIDQERERCAKIAERMTCVYGGPRLRTEGFNLATASIAHQIRSKDSACDPPQAETKSKEEF